MIKQGKAISMNQQARHIPPIGKLSRILAAAGLLLVLVACESKREITGSVPDDYRLRHPITLQQSARTIDIPVGIHSERLTPSARSAISAYTREFRQERSAVIQIMVPSGAENESNAGYLAKEIRTELLRNGVEASQIDLLPYSAPHATDAPIRLAYPRIEAKTLTCGTHPHNLAKTSENRSHFDFGCSTQQNLAASVADPQDLIQPRGWTPRDANRRSVVTEKYRKGEQTWSQDLGDKAGSSSEVMR